MDLTRLDAVSLLTLCAWGEARGEAVEGQLAVMHCVNNRVQDPRKRFGETHGDVILKPYQFSCFNANDPNYPKILALAERLPTALAAHEQPVSQLWFLASGVLSEDLLDNTHGANHYFVAGIPVPKWAQGKEPVAKIGFHLFFKL